MKNRTALILAAMLVLSTTGCKKKEDGFKFRPKFSMNLAKPEKNWPGSPKKTLTPTQQDVYVQRGQPDFIRFWWKGQDDFAAAGEVRPSQDEEAFVDVRQSWVYVRQSDEVIFDTPVTSHSIPICDRLQVLMKEGDPQERKYVTAPNSSGDEIWHYYTTGMVYRFDDKGTLIKANRQHPPMPWRPF